MKKLIAIIASTVCVTTAQARAFDSHELAIMDCITAVGLVQNLIGMINSKFTVKDAVYVHDNSIVDLPTKKRQMYDEVFYTGLSIMHMPAKQSKQLLIDRCIQTY